MAVEITRARPRGMKPLVKQFQGVQCPNCFTFNFPQQSAGSRTEPECVLCKSKLAFTPQTETTPKAA